MILLYSNLIPFPYHRTVSCINNDDTVKIQCSETEFQYEIHWMLTTDYPWNDWQNFDASYLAFPLCLWLMKCVYSRQNSGQSRTLWQHIYSPHRSLPYPRWRNHAAMALNILKWPRVQYSLMQRGTKSWFGRRKIKSSSHIVYGDLASRLFDHLIRLRNSSS